MKRRWVLLLVLILLPFAALTAFKVVQQRAVRAWVNDSRCLDHAELVEACREMIDKRQMYRNDNAHWPAHYSDMVIIDERVAPYSDKIPSAVRELTPRSIMIDNEYVLLDLRDKIPFTRLCILGFKEGVREFGTFKYVDGLWFWNGHRREDLGPSSAMRRMGS